MCRLLGFTSSERKSFYDVIGADFESFVELSVEHKDGWGIGYEGEVIKDLKPAKESDLLTQTGKNLETHGALLHLRQASKGISVDINNNHPFTHGTITFMHNGTIKSISEIEKLIDPRYLSQFTSTTDSERYFYTVLTAIDELGLLEGVRNAVRTLAANCDFTSINCMLLSPDYMVAVCEFNESDATEWTVNSHYELRYSVEDGVIKVASTGWGKDHWSRLENHSILVINRRDLTFEVLPL